MVGFWFDAVVRIVDVRAPQVLGVELPEGSARIRHDVLRLHRRALPLPDEPAGAARRRGQSPSENRWQRTASRHLAGLQEALRHQADHRVLRRQRRQRRVHEPAEQGPHDRHDGQHDRAGALRRRCRRDHPRRRRPLRAGAPRRTGTVARADQRTQVFEGYTNAEATQKKIVRNGVRSEAMRGSTPAI